MSSLQWVPGWTHSWHCHFIPPPCFLPSCPSHPPNPDDLWSLDLNKLDGWRCVKENTVGEEAFKDLSSDEWETGSDSE